MVLVDGFVLLYNLHLPYWNHRNDRRNDLLGRAEMKFIELLEWIADLESNSKKRL